MTIEQIRDMERRLEDANLPMMAFPMGYTDVKTLLDEVRRLRQGLWDVCGISGTDLDGNDSPDVLSFPDIVDYAKQEVKLLRDDYDECLAECTVHD